MTTNIPLAVEGLSKSFKVRRPGRKPTTFQAVEDVSFELAAGETLAIVGESGSGKSTVARCCMRLYDPDSGRIRVDGESIEHHSQRRMRPVRAKLQMVFQDPMGSLNPRKRCVDSIADPLRALGSSPRAARRTALETAELVGLPKALAMRFPHELSGGQRQRVGIARALSVRPRILILDEAVSALDVSVQAQVLNLLKDVQDELGLAYLFITHDMGVVRFISDRVAVMSRGRIVETGTTSDVLERPGHEYTQRLLSSVPSLAQNVGG